MARAKISKACKILSLGCVGYFILTSGTTPAQAGFQWTPPTQRTSAAPEAVVTLPPITSVREDTATLPLPNANPAPTSSHIGTRRIAPPVIRRVTPQTPAPIQTEARSLKRYNARPAPVAPQAAIRGPVEYSPPSASIQSENRANSRVFLPDDAPDNVRATINPYPAVPTRADIPPAVRSKAVDVYTPPRSAATSTDAGRFSEVIGFGSDVPLALALRQVVPAEYSYAFAQSVNLGERVSWNGGKPWNTVISEMVAPLGYSLSIRGNKVYISGQDISYNSAPAARADSLQTAALEEKAYTPVTTKRAPQPLQALAAIEVAATQIDAPRKSPSLGTPIGGLPFEKALIEPAAGNAETSAPISLAPPQAVTQPRTKIISNAPKTNSVIEALDALEPSVTPRRIRRDPGDQALNAQPDLNLSGFAKAGSIIPSKSTEQWSAQAGDSLKDTLARWSTQAGMQLVWDAQHDFTLPANVQSGGSFETAVQAIFAQGFGGQDAPQVQFITQPGQKTSQVLIKDQA